MHVERLTESDATSLAVDRLSPPPHVAALLTFGPAPHEVSDEELLTDLSARLTSVRRLRQVLVPAPFAGGGPYWADAPLFRAGDHLDLAVVESGDRALLEMAADTASSRFPRNRPQWRARLVRQADGRRSLIVVLHHVITDGLGGLAQLGALADGLWHAGESTHAEPLPTHRDLRADAARRRRSALRRLPDLTQSAMAGMREMGLDTGRPRLVDRSFLNRPTGPVRRLAWTSIDLAQIRVAARALDASVNDVVVAAVAGVLGDLMTRSGEHPTHVVVSVPISGRDGDLRMGNQVGVLPVDVPLLPDLRDRVRAVSRVTSARKAGGRRGSSATVLSVITRTLGAVGGIGLLLHHQRLITTFESNMRGPDARLALAGQEIERVVPFALSAGNVGVSFLACSYAGTLGITVVADPDAVVQYRGIADEVGRELSEFAAG